MLLKNATKYSEDFYMVENWLLQSAETGDFLFFTDGKSANQPESRIQQSTWKTKSLKQHKTHHAVPQWLVGWL